MYRTHRLLARALAVLTGFVLLAGSESDCVPHEPIRWSPDGQTALLIPRDREPTRFFDARGNVSDPLETRLLDAVWFNDSRRILGVEKQSFTSWEELARSISTAVKVKLASRADALREAILDHEGSFDTFEPECLGDLTELEKLTLWLHVRAKHGDALAEKLGDKWAELQNTTAEAPALRIYDMRKNRLEAGGALATVLAEFAPGSLRISPDNEAFLYAVQTPSGESDIKIGQLLLGCVQKDFDPQVVSSRAGLYSDFSHDGQWIVFATMRENRDLDDNGVPIGMISRRRIRDAEGRWLEQMGDREDLAAIAFSPLTRVRTLPDGVILFNSVDLHLPAAVQDEPGHGALFSINPARPARVHRVLTTGAEQQLPEGALALGQYEVSPDGRFVWLPASSGVSLFDMTTGSGIHLSPGNNPDVEVKESPGWRPPHDLSFIVSDARPWGGPQAQGLILWSPDTGRARCLSKNWSENALPDDDDH